MYHYYVQETSYVGRASILWSGSTENKKKLEGSKSCKKWNIANIKWNVLILEMFIYDVA